MQFSTPPAPYCQKFGDFTIRHALDRQSFEADYQFQLAEYGNEAYSFEHMLKTWERYPLGAYLLWEGNRVVGDLHLWPVDDEWATSFIDGKIDYYVDFTPKSLADVLVKGCQRWRVGSLIIHPDYRKPSKMNPIGFLLAAALNDWAETAALTYPVQVFTTAYTPQSAALLRRFGFERIREPEQMANNTPLYALTANSKSELTQTLFRRGLPKFLTAETA
jgi:hypothetical protein